jgi:hypothetical protein
MVAVLAAAALLAGGTWIGTRPNRVAAEETGGPVILTVTGEITKPNRGPYDPATDKFFGQNDIHFREGKGFDFAALEALDRVKVRADFPRGETVHEFEGPSLAAVLEAAGAKGETVVLVALDGYRVEMKVSDLVRQGAVLALRRDGQALGIGDFGPAQIVFPRAEREDLKDMTDDAWIWSVYQIDVQ